MSQILKVGIAGYGVVGQRRRMVVEKHPKMIMKAVCDKKLKLTDPLMTV